MEAEPTSSTWDLSSLTSLISGGELNDTVAFVAASAILERHGACRNVKTTGFGMTETCAGSIYSLECPEIDVKHGRFVASIGKCIPGIEMRISLPDSENSTIGEGVAIAEIGQTSNQVMKITTFGLTNMRPQDYVDERRKNFSDFSVRIQASK
jgi:hypothetical protein